MAHIHAIIIYNILYNSPFAIINKNNNIFFYLGHERDGAQGAYLLDSSGALFKIGNCVFSPLFYQLPAHCCASV